MNEILIIKILLSYDSYLKSNKIKYIVYYNHSILLFSLITFDIYFNSSDIVDIVKKLYDDLDDDHIKVVSKLYND